MSLYDEIVPPLSKELAAISAWLDKAVAHAQARKFDPDLFLASRLAPDQFPLAKQIQAACDQSKFAAARVSGKEPPKHPDTEKTIAELKARIETAQAYLASFTPADFEGAEQRVLPLYFAPGKVMSAPSYLREYLLPNFYFHLTHTYAILRRDGVELGKRDFIGRLSLRDA